MIKQYLSLFLSIAIVAICVNPEANAQKKGAKSSGNVNLTSGKLDEEGVMLDQQVLNLNKKITEVVNKYKLLSAKDIRILPYRMTYRLGNDYIEIETYKFTRDILLDNKILGLKTKRTRIYINGQAVSKIETEIIEKQYTIESNVIVRIIDPSPGVAGTDDVVFNHFNGSIKTIDNKKLGAIRNNMAFPVRNSIKRDFLIPHLTFVYNTILSIAETYYKGIKDADRAMTDFIIKATEY